MNDLFEIGYFGSMWLIKVVGDKDLVGECKLRVNTEEDIALDVFFEQKCNEDLTFHN